MHVRGHFFIFKIMYFIPIYRFKKPPHTDFSFHLLACLREIYLDSLGEDYDIDSAFRKIVC